MLWGFRSRITHRKQSSPLPPHKDPIAAGVECALADVCIVTAGVRSAEGSDRKTLSLGPLNELLIHEIAKV
jgi:hypothetical protein